MAFEFDASTAVPEGFDPSTAKPYEPRSALGEIANQGAAGIVSDLPAMVGKAAQYASKPGDKIYGWGKEVADAADKRGQAPEYQPDPESHNGLTNMLASGARMIPQSIAPAALVGGALAAAPVALPGAAILGAGAVLGSLPAAMSQGQSTLDKAEKAGVDYETAKVAARKTALIEGAGETIGTLAGAKILGIGGKALSTTLARATGRAEGSAAGHVLGDATSGAVLKPWAKSLPEAFIGEVGTEMGQGASQAAVEQSAGIDTQSPLDAAKEAIAPTVGMSLLLAPFGLAGHGLRARANERRAATLTSADAAPEQRAAVAKGIYTDLKSVDEAAAENFAQHAAQAIDDQAPLEIGEHLFSPPTGERRVAESDAANAELGDAAAAYDGMPGTNQQIGFDPTVPSTQDTIAQGYTPVEMPPGVVAVPRQDGQGVATIDRATGPLSNAAADAVESGLSQSMNTQVGNVLKSYPTSQDAQAEMGQRPDADRLQIIRHPRVNDRFAVVPKDAMALRAQDEKAAQKAATQTALEQDASQEELQAQGAQPVDGMPATQAANARPAEAARASAIERQAVLGDQESALGSTIDAGAHQAATSIENSLSEPTDAQKAAGNYQKGHVKISGLSIAVENPVGSTRSGKDASGQSWVSRMEHHYGYIKGTIGNDKDHVDTFIKPGTPVDYAGPVHIVDQVDPKTGKFDEHKVMIGFASAQEAQEAYHQNYAEGWKGMGAMTTMPMEGLKAWAKDGVKNKPVSEQAARTDATAAQDEIQQELQAPAAQPADNFTATQRMGNKMQEAARRAAENRAASLAEQEATPAEPKAAKQRKGKTAPDPKASAVRSKRLPGESADAYLTRRATEINKAKAETGRTNSTLPTAAGDLANLQKALGKDAEGATIADHTKLPDANKASGKLSRQGAEFMRHVAGLFGKRVVFVDGMSGDGMWNHGKSIYLSTNSSVSQLRVLGHEMVHAMKAQSTESYNHMMDALGGLLTNDELEAQFKDYYPGKEYPGPEALDEKHEGGPQTLREFLSEEWMADIGGNRFAEAGFWSDVFTQVEAKHGNAAAKGIIAKLRMAIVNALNKLLKLANGSQFAVDARLGEQLEAARTAVAEGFAQYAAAVKDGQAGSQSSGDTKFAGKRPAQDAAIGDRTDIDKLAAGKVIPESAAVGGLESSLAIARGKTYNKGRQLKVDIQDAVKKAAKAAGVDLEARTKETHKFLADMVFKDAAYALKSNENAIGWYDSKISRAVGALAVVHPEINSDPVARLAFMWSLAVTSNGLKVAKNFELAEKAYRQWRDSHAEVGKRSLPTDVGIGNAAGAINNGMALFNTLSLKMDQARLAKFMATEFPAGSISKMLGLDAGGEWAGTPVRGAAILGPKIGNGFYMNLNGYFDALTMDRWLMRTYGRMTGTLLNIDQDAIKGARSKFKLALSKMTRAERAKMSEVVGKPVTASMNQVAMDDMAAAIDKASMKTDKRALMQASDTTNRFRLDGRGLAKALDGQKEAPDGPAERNWIRAIFATSLQKLKDDGKNMTMSDLQALLWYPERRLYDAAKADETMEEGYEDDEAPDYANAAMALAMEHGHRKAAVLHAMDLAEAKGTVRAPTMTESEKDALAKEFRAAPEQSMHLAYEVAPDPADQEATSQWNALDVKAKTEITKEVKDFVVDEAAKVVGVELKKTVSALGGFAGQVNPNLITEYQVGKVSIDQARQVASVLGLALDQDSVALVDPRVKSTAGLIRVTFSGKVEKHAKSIFGYINAAIPQVDAFTARGSNFDILNFTDMSNEELSQKILAALEPSDLPMEFVISSGDTHSELVEKDAYEGHIQGARPGAGGEVYAGAQRLRDRVRSVVKERIAQSVSGSAGAAQRASDAGAVAEAKRSSQRTGDGSGRTERGGLAPLEGAPAVQDATGPDAKLVEVAERYARDNGITLRRQAEYVAIDPERAKRIADAYAAMPHAPNDPKVKEAFANLIKQTVAQYRALEAAGYKFYLFDENNDPYAGNPWSAMRDIRANKTMGVFATEAGFGSGATTVDTTGNPLEADTGIKWPYGSLDGPQKRVLANDLFRAVHDAFGHGLEGSGFRAQGEENAWQAHARLFTGSALGAITSETRGQNSWLNYGPHGEANRNAKVEDTVFADQKTGLMPEWTWTEGRVGDAKMSAARATETPAFKAWFGGSKVTAEDGTPQVVYHGTVVRPDSERVKGMGLIDSFDRMFTTQFRAHSVDTVGSWFSTNPGDGGAEMYSGKSSGSAIYPVYLSIKNPQITTFYLMVRRAKLLANGVDDDRMIGKPEVDAYRKWLKTMGKDGVKIEGSGRDGSTEFDNQVAWIALEPEQIKSATGNNGQFDASNPDIRRSASRAQIEAGASAIANMDPSKRDDTELGNFPGGPAAYNLYEARELVKKPSEKLKRITENNSFSLWQDYDYVANVDGEHFGVSKQEDPDEVDDETKFVFSFESLKDGRSSGKDTTTDQVDELFKEMRASKNSAAFSKKRIVGDQGRTYTPDQLKAMDRIGARVEEPTLKERMQVLFKDVGKKLAQGLADQFAPVKAMDGKAYGLLRLAKGSAGAFEAMLSGGKLKLSDGVYDFDDSKRGGVIDSLLKPLQGEHHDFFRWIAANRAESLKQVGKEHLFEQSDIDALKTLATGKVGFKYTIQNGIRKGQVTSDRAEIYRDSLATFNGFNKNVLDMAEQSGLIDGGSRHMWESEFYVPFYRVSDESDGGVRGMNIKGAAVRQQAFKALKGGKNALNADLLDNTLMNWAHLLDASAKNRAAKATIEAAEKMGIAMGGNQTALAQLGSSVHNKHGVVWFMDGGQKRYSLIDNQGDGPYIMTALTSLEYAGMRNPVMNAMGAMKHTLTVGVTASPFFKVRNLIRDSVQVIGTGAISYNPAKNLADGWKLTDPKSDGYFRLLAGGGTIHFGTMLEGSEAKRVQALVESGVDSANILDSSKKVKAFYRKFIEPGLTAYNELGNRGEAVNRAALYDQLRKQGVSHADASLQARDLMDFSMQGSFTSVRFLTQVVPFMNARIQGLYKLGKSVKEDPARFATVLGATALISVGLLAAYRDDDDWKKRSDSDRNNFWWFKFAGQAFRIPKPFEIGSIGTLAERGFELAFDKEMTDKRFMDQVLTLLGDNLSMNPIPQLVKPMLDVYANKSSFSGMPIENMAQQRLKSEYRFNDRTSMTARGASTAMNAVTGAFGKEALSPVQVDAMLQGYFGWLGTFVVSSGDVLARPATNQPTQATPDYMKVVTGNMVSDLRDAPSRYVSQMYDQAKVIEEAHATWQALIKEGKGQEASEFLADNRDSMAKYQRVEAVKRQESKLNNMLRMVERNTAMDPDTKREKIRSIREQKDRLAKALV